MGIFIYFQIHHSFVKELRTDACRSILHGAPFKYLRYCGKRCHKPNDSIKKRGCLIDTFYD